MNRFYLTKLSIVAAIVIFSWMGASAQLTNFTTPGGPVAYTVQSGVTAIYVDMAGGQGGTSQSSTGGKGGRIQCTMAVTPGQVIYVSVGGQGTNHTNSASAAGGANGGGSGYYYGGGGGGASDIRVGGTGTANRVAVAGGGGGGGYDCGTTNGENGGDAGGTAGSNGSYCGTASTCVCGSGATGATPGSGATCYGVGAGTAAGVGGSDAGTTSYGGGGGGGYAGGGAGAYGGGGGGSSYPASGSGSGSITSITNTGSYETGNGYVTICSPNLGSIIGNNPVCTGQVLALTATGSGGSWSSSATSVATVDASGNVTGVSAGNATITYSASSATCGSGFITAVVTVNPSPGPITGSGSVCVGSNVTLSAPGSGVWSSSSAAMASISSSGVVTGVTAGTPNITYTLPSTGCYIASPIVVNPLPGYITGPNNVCAAGATISLGNPSAGGSWSVSNPAIATVTTGSGIVTGGAAGAVTVTYTLPTSCYITTTITVNSLPSAITGPASVCSGSIISLGDPSTGGTWSSSNVAIATVGAGTGAVAGVSAGTANITYTLSSGCSITSSIVVNALPSAIVGTGSVCAGATTAFTDASIGGTWSCSLPTLATIVPTSGAVVTMASGLPVISYTLPTGCVTTTVLTINALPTPFAITGGGAYCVGTGGVHIGLSLSTTGVSYKLYNGPSLVATVGGSNAALDFGAVTTNGTYSVIGTNATTGCVNTMAGSTTVLTNPNPNTYNVTGGGSFCPGGSGVNVYGSGSDAGINYQLLISGVASGAALPGTGMSLNFGPQTAPGSYTIQATNPLTGCISNMVGSAVVSLYPTPVIHNVSAGGAYCAGGTGVAVNLDGSDPSTNYQLMYGTSAAGSAVSGTGSAITFGLQTRAGTYTITASSTATGCSATMNGSSTINVNPLPNVFPVTGGGSYCPGGSGVHIDLGYSSTGVNYQLYLGSAAVGAPVGGANAGLDLGLVTIPGTYSVVATDPATGCSANMSGSANVNISALPAAHTVTGGGSYCSGGSGLHIGLNGSNTGVRYQLMYGGLPTGSSITGTGGTLDFGIQTGLGGYTVLATSVTTSCYATMTGTANITTTSLPNADSVIAAGTEFCAGGAGIAVMLNTSDVGVTYQLLRGGAHVGLPVAGTGSELNFGLQNITGSYSVIATNTITGCNNIMTGTANISAMPAPVTYLTLGGGSYCAGGSGVHITLSSSTLGVNYQLYDSAGTAVVGSPVAGTGSHLDFGAQTAAGAYIIVGTDAISGCASYMAGTATVAITALPAAFTVTGGGSYCMGGSGVNVSLSGSVAGIRYQLYNGGATVGTSMTGGGGAVNFGAQRGSGTYSVVATDPASGCTNGMTGRANISINTPPAAQTVMGGGSYCAGSSGVDVSLNGSVSGVNYQLYRGTTMIGSMMSGTGSSLDFGNQTTAGIYTIIATDTATLCTSNMTGTASVTIVPQPTIDTLMGGGAYCSGGTGRTVTLNGSNSGIQYQLTLGGAAIGGLVSGTGSSINFGLHTGAGAYGVIASPGGLCQTTMAGNPTISVTPLPTAYSVTGGGSYCSNAGGVSVGLSGSDNTVHYNLYKGSTLLGSYSGSGATINFGMETANGIYTVSALDTVTGCTSNMTGSAVVSVIPAPSVFNVAGGGPYCAGGNGVHVLLNGSNTDVVYTLVQSGSATADTMLGTGTILDFGLHTVAGTYTITAKDRASSCAANMADTATISISPIITPSITSMTSTKTMPLTQGQRDTITVTVANGGPTGATYQWYVNGVLVPGVTGNMFISDKFNNLDTVTCTVTSSGMCGGQTASKWYGVTVAPDRTIVSQVATNSASVSVVPNPNKGVFTIAGTLGNGNTEDVMIEVTDMVGHTVYTGKATAVNGNINETVQLTGSVSNGNYLLTLRSETAHAVFHVVIEQ